MLDPFGPDIWIAEGAEPVASFGFRYPVRMVVVRLPDGGLWLWSPIPAAPDLVAAVRALGEVRHLVAPNRLHHLFLADWARAFPAARLHAAPGLRAHRPDLGFDADLGEGPDPDWAGQIDQVVMAGNRIAEEVVFFHRASGTVIVADLLQHVPPGWFTGWRALVARADRMTRPEPQVPWKFRLAFTRRGPAREALARLRGWPVEALVIAHGPPLRRDAAGVLARAFA